MKFEHFKKGPTGLAASVENALNASDDALESVAHGFAFPVHKDLRDMDEMTSVPVDQEGNTVAVKDLLRTSLSSLKEAWEREIEPRLAAVRAPGTETAKGDASSSDFFTIADTASERAIRERFATALGPDTLRIFGEEANKYLGNLDSLVGVRIDPVDGTEPMKFGKADWGIMVGVYAGRPENERQVLGAVLFPEMNMLAMHVEGKGVYVTDLASGESRRIENVTEQNDLRSIIVQVSPHSDIKKQGRIREVEHALESVGGRIYTSGSSCADFLEALMTDGGRAMVIDGDYSQVDFIPFAFLRSVGYKMYLWDGTPVDADDIRLSDKKFIAVPPGAAGSEILEVVKKFAQR